MSLILNTGGLGFIGSHTCINLLSKGLDVLVVDSLVNSSFENLKKIKKIIYEINCKRKGKIFFKKGDLRDRKWLKEVFEDQIKLNRPISSVIHFAGLKSIPDSVKNPLNYWEVNINTTLSLLSVMAKFNCNNLVFSSSASIYETSLGEKLVEDSIKKPINPYGNTKFTIEKILQDLFMSDKDKWKIINLRYFNPVGSHCSGEIGEEPKNESTNLFPILQKIMTGSLKELSIYGNDWPTFDGTCVRDYIHVMDLAEAHFAALKFIGEHPPQFISLNIGTGKGYSVLEIIEKYCSSNKVSIPFKIVGRRPGDLAYLVADNTMALRLLDWSPVRTLEDICIDNYRFIKKSYSNKNL